MGRLLYSAIASLDGFVEDAGGRFDWAVPGPEAHELANELERSVGTHLLGRRMYETMQVWETDPALAEHAPQARDFAAAWQAAEKVVHSRTLREDQLVTRRTRLVRAFDADAVRALKAGAAPDVSVGGAELAAQALRHGLVDECHLFIAPVAVGSGKRALPEGLRLDLELLEDRRFPDGMLYARYRVAAVAEQR